MNKQKMFFSLALIIEFLGGFITLADRTMFGSFVFVILWLPCAMICFSRFNPHTRPVSLIPKFGLQAAGFSLVWLSCHVVSKPEAFITIQNRQLRIDLWWIDSLGWQAFMFFLLMFCMRVLVWRISIWKTAPAGFQHDD